MPNAREWFSAQSFHALSEVKPLGFRQRLKAKIATLPDGEQKRANERLLAKIIAASGQAS